MKRLYLFVFAFPITREQLKSWADSSPLVTTWRTDLPNSMYIVSESTAGELTKDFEAKRGTRGRYLIAEIAENRQGRLPSDTWYFLKNKQVRRK